MKCLFVCIVFMIKIILIIGEDFGTHLPADQLKELNVCIEEHKVDKTKFGALLSSSDHNAHCAMGCFMQKLGIITADLKIDTEKWIEENTKYQKNKDTLEKGNKAFWECYETLKDAEMKTNCDVSLKYEECLKEKFPKN